MTSSSTDASFQLFWVRLTAMLRRGHGWPGPGFVAKCIVAQASGGTVTTAAAGAIYEFHFDPDPAEGAAPVPAWPELLPDVFPYAWDMLGAFDPAQDYEQ